MPALVRTKTMIPSVDRGWPRAMAIVTQDCDAAPTMAAQLATRPNLPVRRPAAVRRFRRDLAGPETPAPCVYEAS